MPCQDKGKTRIDAFDGGRHEQGLRGLRSLVYWYKWYHQITVLTSYYTRGNVSQKGAVRGKGIKHNVCSLQLNL